MEDKNGNILSFIGAEPSSPYEAIRSLLSIPAEGSKSIAVITAIIMLEDGSMFKISTWDPSKIDNDVGGNILLGLIERLKFDVIRELR